MIKILYCLLVSLCGYAVSQNAEASILPRNNLHLQDKTHSIANLTEEQFSSIINSVIDYYRPIVSAKGATLITNNLWTDSTVNASAIQHGDKWIVNMYGGLARRPEITADGFALVVCHELGHHLGGFPFNGDTHWAATEGQADYFATESCAREVWRSHVSENARFRSLIAPYEKAKCDRVWGQTVDQDLCYRIALAGKSLADLFSVLGPDKSLPRFDTPDLKQVSSTFTRHPEAQCRLDTYFNGALCTAAFDTGLIPGRNPSGGQSSVEAEQKAVSTSCTSSSGFVEGVRPLCWFKPQIDFLAMKFSELSFIEKSGNNNGVAEPGETFEALFKLKNQAGQTTTNVVGTLSSPRNDLQIIEQKVQFEDIASGESAPSRTPFVLKVSNSIPCGEIIPLVMRAESDQGSMEIRNELRVGRKITTEVGSASPDVAIPDEDIDGIESKFTSTIEGSASGFALKLDIDHPSIRELRVSVFTPDGKQYRLFPSSNHIDGARLTKREVSFSGIHQTIQVDSKVESLNGTWRLVVKDIDEFKIGRLKSWSVTASKNQCD